ncbi:redox-regulated ATPase YchF [Desulfopila inferna]|uniref:redox-regulated ATPase YchF n=1 Tax=Desulfopila inferna TaxID=468528 RepID=UPI0019634BE3|nr:redox-regulated ATPase YchF [Desulfopila inferna]MBM9604919.1 redox-regulated ATPase YchF [Desulfopila inferna]
MKIGIIGLPQTGKKTLFQTLTGNILREQSGPPKPLPGSAEIIDSRFDALVRLYSPKSEVRAKIELMLLPKLEQENIAKGDIFKDIADVDAICHVIRAFEDESVYHAQGSVDPIRDMEMVCSELLMHDQIFVEKRIERIETAIKKKKDENQEKELILLNKMLDHLEHEKPLRLLEISPDEDFLLKSYPLITRKEMILAFNVSEEDLNNSDILKEAEEKCSAEKMEAMVVSAQVESEIALLDSEEEKQDFLEDLQIEEAALGTLTRLCLRALGLISFFTVGEDEVRQWLVRSNSPAPVAAGVIHSDLQRGFIRAEVMKYDELMEYGSEAELKKVGKMKVEGKEYIVRDGDILNIRFKV